MRQSELKQKIEREYQQSLLGGGISTSIEMWFRDCRPASQQLAMKRLSASTSLRITQPILDMYLRTTNQTRLCVPHLPLLFPRITSRNLLSPRYIKLMLQTTLTPVQKTQLSLSQALFYLILRCIPKFKGSLLPYGLQSVSAAVGHANMIYLDFRHRNIRLYLFEPNGVAFAKQFPQGVNNLKRAWKQVRETWEVLQSLIGSKNTLRQWKLNPSVTLAGGSGIQTELGLWTPRQKEGFAICGAVTYWVFSKWMRSPLTYPNFEAQLLKDIASSEKRRREYQQQLLQFIINVRENVETKYQKQLTRLLKRDWRAQGKKCRHGATIRFETTNPKVQGSILLKPTR